MIVDEGAYSLVGVAEDEAKRQEADRDPESAVRKASSKELDESLNLEDGEKQFFGFV